MNHLRNFSIIAHIDHGKTTLTDRLLEATGTITVGSNSERFLDTNPIEQERGITIKLAPVRMHYALSTTSYILNLIDTPGHVDFSYEVSRALYACEGALLVVDATRGIQAQTLANFDKAKEHQLKLIPVVNKIDLSGAEPERVTQELVATLGFTKDEILYVSAKTGQGIPALLQAIVERIPPPSSVVSPPEVPLRALIFNSVFDPHRGVIAFVKIIEGKIDQDNLSQLYLYGGMEELNPLAIGFFTPGMTPTNRLGSGEVGYIATGHKNIRDVTVGDTITTVGAHIIPIEGYRRPQPMVYMDLYPSDAGDYSNLTDALARLALNDAALTSSPASSPALGHGYRVGFLGILHAEIVSERLSREFALDVVNTSPSVPYHLTLKNGDQLTVSSPADWPKQETITSVQEPIISLTLYTPEPYLGAIMELTQGKRAVFINLEYPAERRVKLEYLMPLSELITNFYDRLKSVSSGYASVQYEHVGYELVDAVKVEILLNSEPAEAFSFIAPRVQAESRGRALVDKLKEVIPRSQIEIAIQAAIGGKIIARSTVKAFRKDVTAKLYGGDATRRMKLLEKQKKGKKKMRRIGSVAVPPDAFTAVLKL